MSAAEIETVVLKNGAEEAEALVNITMFALNKLSHKNPIAFYELVQICRDPNHELFGNTGEILRDLRFIEQNDTVHSSIRNIVVSAAKGEMLEMCLTNPVKKSE